MRVLALLETLFDIIRLRKGPDAIPHSTVMLVVIVALWLGSNVVATLMVPELDAASFLPDFVVVMAGLLCYAAVISLAGHGARLMQAIMAVLGCSAILILLYVAGKVFLSPFLSENLTTVVVTLILLWSVPVEGHIISRTIERHWYFGIVIAMAVFIFQLTLRSAIAPVQAT